MTLACPKMPGISLNITNVCVQTSLKHTLPDFKNPESAIWRQVVVITSPFYAASQIHKVRPNAASFSHRDEQDSITIIIMNSNQKHDLISLSFALMSNRVEKEKI